MTREQALDEAVRRLRGKVSAPIHLWEQGIHEAVLWSGPRPGWALLNLVRAEYHRVTAEGGQS